MGIDFSVVIPAYNEALYLEPTLRSIRAATVAFAPLGWESELVVCDNNSTDRTPELAREAGAKVVFEPVNQIGARATPVRLARAATGSSSSMPIRSRARNCSRTWRRPSGADAAWPVAAR